MDTQTTTWSKIIQAIALVLVLVAVSACSKKEGSKASVRNRNTRTNTYTPTGGQQPGTPNSQFGTINTNQQYMQQFFGTTDPSVLGQVNRVIFTGRVSDGYSQQAGGSVRLIVNDSLGEIQSDFNCTMNVQNVNRVIVNCTDNVGSLTFDGYANSSTYSGQVTYDNGYPLGNFTVSTCVFLDAGC